MHINPAHRGKFHEDLGLAPNAAITGADVMKGLDSSDPAVRRRANFARMAKRKFKPLKKK
jgi:hypothetical protein